MARTDAPNFLALCYATDEEKPLLDAIAADSQGNISEDRLAASDSSQRERLELMRQQALHMRTPDGRSSMHRCVERGWVSLAAALVSLGGSPLGPQLGRSLNTPLHLAARNGPPQMLKVLLRARDIQHGMASGTSVVDVQNTNGDTPLMFACAGGSLGAAAMLLGAGASPLARNSDGVSPLTAAISSGGNAALLDLLLRHSSKLSDLCTVLNGSASGSQPLLHISVLADNAEAVEVLLRAGADPLGRNPAGKSAREVAARQAPPTCSRCLQLLEAAAGPREAAAEEAAASLLRAEEQRARGTAQTRLSKVTEEGDRSAPSGPRATGASLSDSPPGAGEGSVESVGCAGRDSDTDETTVLRGEGLPGREGGPPDMCSAHATEAATGRVQPVTEAEAGTATTDNEWHVVGGGRRSRKSTEPKSTNIDANRRRPKHTGKSGRPATACQLAAGACGVASRSPSCGTQAANRRPPQGTSPEAERVELAGQPSVCSGPWRSDDSDGAAPRPNWLGEAQEVLCRVHPKATSLELRLENVFGIGISKLSVSQLEALEEVHHALLEELAEARVQLACRQREQQRAEAAKLAEEVTRASGCARDGDGTVANS